MDLQQFECNICKAKFKDSTNQTFLNHLKTHVTNSKDVPEPESTEEKITFKCNSCEKQFTRSYNLMKHQEKVHNIKIASP